VSERPKRDYNISPEMKAAREKFKRARRLFDEDMAAEAARELVRTARNDILRASARPDDENGDAA